MKALLLLMVLLSCDRSVHAASAFFQVRDIKFLSKPGKSGAGIWASNNTPATTDDVFIPCLEVQLATALPARSEGLAIHAHFLDATGKVAVRNALPAPAKRDGSTRDTYDIPVIFPAKGTESVYFPVPKQLLGKTWSAVVVFGDKNEAAGRKYPEGPLFTVDFPGKEFVLAPPKAHVARKGALDPLIEHVVHTRNPKHPKITLFVRIPNGISEATDIKGVMAMCLLAGGLDSIRRQLQKADQTEVGDILRFADRNKLAVICWGARTLWNPGASYDELDRETVLEMDRSFDEVAAAWERGIGEIHERYGVPKSNFLLWGQCASAQWAHRLALRKPDFFLAAYIHIPSSFDAPTVDGSKILWLLTTGELDGGYARAGRWYQDCRKAGYPMIYKPIINLAHAGSPISENLGMKFFEYALGVKDQREAIDRQWTQIREQRKASGIAQPWLEGFVHPEYVGDYKNQELFPGQEKNLVPEAFRVPLPTKAIADAWNK